MNNSYDLFRKEAFQLKERYPGLTYRQDGSGIPAFEGILPLVSEENVVIDSYKVRILCSSNYPLTFPFVFETGGRIPINLDWHIHLAGNACICSYPEEIIFCLQGITLQSFISNHVIPYFFNQKHRELYGYFLMERSHGRKGNIEFFEESFKTADHFKIAQMLNYIKQNQEPNRVAYCFCGSGVKYRNCHRSQFRKFKSIPAKILDRFIWLILYR